MNNVANFKDLSNTELTMSSREIAELIGSRHDKVKQSIERLTKKGVIDVPPMGNCERINDLGLVNTSSYYVFSGEQGKRDSIIVIAQMSPEFTAKLVDRWQELENGLVPKTLPDALRAYANQVELTSELKNKIAIDAPKVEFMDNFIEVGTTKSLRETAKILKMAEKAMIESLIHDHILFRQSGNLLPYAEQLNMGHFEVKTGEANGHAYTQTRVTTKGMSYIAKRYASELMVA